MKVFKRILIILAVIFAIIAVTAAVSLAILQARTNGINDDISEIYTNEKYSNPVFVSGVDVIKQDVSCGYAVIEMFSSWNGNDITEESLYNEYGKVVTSTGQSFCNEKNKRYPEYTTTLHYSLIIGADIPADIITVANPYGYYEEITVAELLDRTSFEAYENMPLFLRLGFAFGIFEKNTVFMVR